MVEGRALVAPDGGQPGHERGVVFEAGRDATGNEKHTRAAGAWSVCIG